MLTPHLWSVYRLLSAFSCTGLRLVRLTAHEYIHVCLAAVLSFTLSPTFLSLGEKQSRPQRLTRTVVLSYRSCRLLRYNKLYGDSPETSASPFEIELRRRCFWAAWATVCIATEARTESEFAWLEAVNLPLPATITTSRLGIDVELGGRMDVNWNFVPPRREFPTKDKPFVLAEIMSLLGVWYEAHPG